MSVKNSQIKKFATLSEIVSNALCNEFISNVSDNNWLLTACYSELPRRIRNEIHNLSNRRKRKCENHIKTIIANLISSHIQSINQSITSTSMDQINSIMDVIQNEDSMDGLAGTVGRI